MDFGGSATSSKAEQAQLVTLLFFCVQALIVSVRLTVKKYRLVLER